MANKTQQLTVADLEAAKKKHEKMADLNCPYDRIFTIAATCIGIVEEMVKLDTKGVEYLPWQDQIDLEDEHALVDGAVGEVIVDERHCQNIRFISGLTQVHHKAVAAFGGGKTN